MSYTFTIDYGLPEMRSGDRPIQRPLHVDRVDFDVCFSNHSTLVRCSVFVRVHAGQGFDIVVVAAGATAG